MKNKLSVVLAGLLLGVAIAADMFFMAEGAEARPPSHTIRLVTGYPDAVDYVYLNTDPFLNFDRNWIVIENADGTQDVYHQNCKVAVYDASGNLIRIDYYGDDYVPESFDGSGIVFPFMGEVTE